MAKLYISEYERLGVDADGKLLPIGMEPSVATQVVDFTAGSTASAAFNANTKFVRIHPDTACYLKFGTAPTATTATDAPMAAAATELFAVQPGYKVAAVQ